VGLDREPPSLVEEANAAVRWLSQAIVELDQDAADATAAIIDGLGRVFSLEVSLPSDSERPGPTRSAPVLANLRSAAGAVRSVLLP
jgi:hypothetical protein